MSPNATCSISLETTIHIYTLKKIEEIPKFIAFIATCLKVEKAVLATIVL
jgi:hypothetical protein